MFQSTHLREVRLVRELRQFGRHGFNPRTYERCDNADTRLQQVVKRFNPRTYERCDNKAPSSLVVGQVSIHAPTRGATLMSQNSQVSIGFNPRTYERCDLSLRRKTSSFSCFNPRTYERCD